MREIKFRAWLESTKEFKYFQSPNGNSAITEQHEDWSIVLDWVERWRLPLQQFTGLYDKDGNEIYEGDVLMDGTGEKYPVIFLNGMFCVKCDGFTSPITKPFLTILGNTYENPELLNPIDGAAK